MKTPNSFLFDLIHSLTKSEKRYIKVQSGQKEKDYIQLLDALLAQKVFNEDQLVKDYKEEGFTKHLAVNKRYLFELILKQLARFGQKSVEDKVFQQINAANVLIEKGLFKAAYSELKKGQKVASQYELFELQIMMFGIEKILLSQQQFKSQDEESIHQLFADESYCLAQLKNTNTYWYLSRQIAHFQMRYQKIQSAAQKSQLTELTKSPRFQLLSEATNFKSKIYFYQANATYQFILGDVKRAYETNRQFLDLLEAHPHFLKLYAERYLATLNNMLIDSLVIGHFDILQEGIDRLVKTVALPAFKSIKNIKSRVFRQRYLLLLNWAVSQNDLEKALEWIPEIEAGLLEHSGKIEKHHRITFYYLTAYILFLNEKYDEALHWNDEILNDPKEDVVKEIFNFSRTLNLLLHYELSNYSFLDSLLQSTPKLLRSRRKIYATEKAIFRYLGKQIKTINKSEKIELTNKFKEEIEALFEQPTEKRVFNYLDVRKWIG